MNQPRTSPPGSSPITAIAYGVSAWLCYGFVELFCLAVLPRFAEPGYEYRAYDARFSALFLSVYAVIGAGTGFLAGTVLPRIGRLRISNPADVFRAAATVSVSSVLLLNLLILWGNSPFSPILLVVNLILVIAVSAGSAGSGDMALQCRPFAAAWLPCASYVGCEWLADWLGSGSTSHALVAIYGSLLIAALWGTAWLFGRTAERSEGRPRAGLMGAAVAAVLCCGVTAALQPAPFTETADIKAPASGRPNIIVVSLDTVRADHLSIYAYGRDTTPNLRKFAAESTVFTRAVASSDMTLPTHASLFTGLYPSQHGAHFSAEHRMGAPLDSRFPTMAERLRSKGFWTGGAVANGGYLSVAFGLHHGFEYWDQRLPAAALAPVPEQYLRGRLRDVAARFLPTSQLDRVSRSGAEMNDAAFAALRQRSNDGRPFFLFVNYMDAHVPYIPPAPYDTMFPGKDPAFTESRYMSTYLDVIAHDRKISDRAHAHLVSQYDGGIAYLDAQLGAFFERLKAAGLYENSLIVVTSDHGEALGERNCMDHGGMSLYDEQIHVPLLIKFPNNHSGGVVSSPVGTVDILPTVLDVAGLPVPKNIPGQSLRQPIPDGRELISESFPGGRAYFTNAGRFDRMYRSAVSTSVKYIAPSTGKPELYDLRQDPGESKNLFNPQERQSQDAAARLLAWSKTVGQHSQGPVKVNRETMERLRSLGYVGQ